MKFNPLYSWHQIQSFFTFEWENSLFLYGLVWPFVVYFIKYLRQRGNQPRLELSLSIPLQQNRVALLLSYVPMGIQILCICLLYTSPSPRDRSVSRMPSSA